MTLQRPTVKVVNGEGKPRITVVKATPYYITSVGVTAYTGTTVTEAEGSPVTITTSSVANPTIITTSGAHGRSMGDWIRITGHSGSTPDLNSRYKVLRIVSSTQLEIGVAVTVGGTGGTLCLTPAFINRGIGVGMRIVDYNETNNPFYGKITSVADETLTVDEWFPSTPSAAVVFKVNGYVIDLPYCGRNKLRETFTPDVLVHNLYRNRLESEQYGYLYNAVLDYSEFITGDVIIDLAPILNMSENDYLVLTPRVDKKGYQYKVVSVGAIDLSMIGRGKGHAGFKLTFNGAEPVGIFPGTEGGYGTNYGTDYGDCL